MIGYSKDSEGDIQGQLTGNLADQGTRRFHYMLSSMEDTELISRVGARADLLLENFRIASGNGVSPSAPLGKQSPP